MSSSIDAAYRAAHFDQIHCDDEACTAVLHAQDLNHESSIALAHQHGWQAWMGTMRSYHRCGAHYAPYAPPAPSVPVAAFVAGETAADQPEGENASERSLRTTGGMQNPHTHDCRNASCGLVKP